jgi:hypothetical protein
LAAWRLNSTVEGIGAIMSYEFQVEKPEKNR